MADKNKIKPRAAIVSGGSFLDKYFTRHLENAGYTLEGDGAPDLCIAVAGADISGALAMKPRRLVMVNPAGSEKDIIPSAGESAAITVINLPLTVGTGMNGILRSMVSYIARGTHFNIEGNDAHVSLIHANDAARYAVALAGTAGEFDLTDGAEHTWSELADALAARIDRRTIFTVSPAKAKWLGRFGWLFGGPDSGMIATTTADMTMTASPLPDGIDISPVNVTEYLTNHKYDENDI